MKKFIPTSLVLIFAAFTFVGRPTTKGQEIHVGTKFVSPDRRYTAEYLFDDDNRIKITDNQTGHADAPIDWWSVPHSIRWTGDSKTIVVVSHIAGGSQASLIHFKKGKWVELEAAPPTKHSPVEYRVIEEKVGISSVTLTYEVTNQAPNGARESFYRCSFKIDPETGAIFNVKNTHSKSG